MRDAILASLVANGITAAIGWAARVASRRPYNARRPYFRPVALTVTLTLWVVVAVALTAIFPDQRVLVTLLSVGALSAFAFHELTAYWRSGVTGADPNIRTGVDSEASLRLAQNSFEFLGTGAAKLTTSSHFDEAMRRCHRDNDPIRFLLLDPERGAVELGKAAKRGGQPPHEYQQRVRSSLARLADLVDAKAINIEVRFYSTPQAFRLVFLNNTLCLTGFNVYGETTPPSNPQLYIAKYHHRSDTKSFYFAFRQYFDRLWDESYPWAIQEWIQ